jgi:hypothetical protein
VERWQRIEHIFHEALGRDGAARESYVSEACQATASYFAKSRRCSRTTETMGIPNRGLHRPRRLYRATDTRLNREVAIKVSAARFSERFETAARAVASVEGEAADPGTKNGRSFKLTGRRP